MSKELDFVDMLHKEMNELKDALSLNEEKQLNATTIYNYEKQIDMLYKKLAEKDKEIEKLKNFMSKWHFENFESFENHYNYLMSLKNREQLMIENEAMKETIANLLGQKKTSSKAIRKQVCDEIREKLKTQIIPAAGIWLSYYDIRETNDLLDQIEQGEQA